MFLIYWNDYFISCHTSYRLELYGWICSSCIYYCGIFLKFNLLHLKRYRILDECKCYNRYVWNFNIIHQFWQHDKKSDLVYWIQFIGRYLLDLNRWLNKCSDSMEGSYYFYTYRLRQLCLLDRNNINQSRDRYNWPNIFVGRPTLFFDCDSIRLKLYLLHLERYNLQYGRDSFEWAFIHKIQFNNSWSHLVRN